MAKGRSYRSSGVNLEGALIGIIMVIALVVGLYAILPTFFNATNTTAVAALGAPQGAEGIFNVLPIIGGILVAIGVLVAIVRVTIKRRG